MRAVFTIARKDLRQRARDRTAYIVGFVAPLALATLIGLAFGRSGVDFHTSYAVVDRDHGALARSFLTDVLGGADLRKVASVRTVPGVAAAERLAEDGKVSAAFVIPPGFSDQSRTPPVAMRVVRSADAGKSIGADVAVSIAQSFAARVDAVRLSVATAIAAGASPQQVETVASAAARQPSPIDERELAASRSDAPQGSIFAPAMAIFFLYFVVGFGAQSLLAERRDGTLARLLAAPIPSRSILVGKAAATYTLGVTSLATTAIASSVLLDARWGDLLTASALILVTVFAVTGIGALIVTVLRSETQVRLAFSVVTMVFAILGGNFVNLANAPDLLQRISLATPNGWALHAFGDIAAEGGGIATVLPAVLAVGAFGMVTWGIALARSNRLVRL
ncbi:MAG: ABC transporter permease [Acidimicrobiia bacterium]